MIGHETISADPRLVHINHFFKMLDKHGVALFAQDIIPSILYTYLPAATGLPLLSVKSHTTSLTKKSLKFEFYMGSCMGSIMICKILNGNDCFIEQFCLFFLYSYNFVITEQVL